MIFEVRYLAVFQPVGDSAATVAAALKQAYEDELGESPDSAFIAARLTIELIRQRDDGLVIVAFKIADDREAGQAASLCSAFGESLSGDPSVEHVLKFQDSLQCMRYQQYAQEVYELEMRLRETISFIFIDTYGGDYYNLLKDSAAKMAVKNPPSPGDYKAHHENEFFFLLFDQYIKVNERRAVTNVADLLNLIGNVADLAELQAVLVARPIPRGPYADFLASIKEWIDSIEKLRNCVAHNRSHGRDVPSDYERAKRLLHAAIDAFFKELQPPLAPAEPGAPEGATLPASPPEPAPPAEATPPPAVAPPEVVQPDGG